MTTMPPALARLDTLGGLRFENRFTRDLPADPSDANRPRQVLQAGYSRVRPTPTAAPLLVAHAREVAELLGIDPAVVASPEFTEVMSGNAVVAGMDTHAACYGGHQFGNWAGQLGDGRAITLGEVRTPSGEPMTLQLKGAGPTPYSRTADGLAVLRSSVREFLCSEAMFHLGVPTTRALSLTLTGDEVLRDMLYDGHPAFEPGAVVCRVAPSFIRFGNFEIFMARDDVATLRALADHTIATHFAHLVEPDEPITAATYLAWFAEVVERTAEMIVGWQRVGFVHGVMNTDNMSVHGITIDYGPYGWLDDFDPGWTPNTTDAAHRRYRYANQPAIAHWNLSCLANAIHPLIGEVEPLQAALDTYVERFNASWPQMINAKLGLGAFEGGADEELGARLLALLPRVETDMTLFFRGLADVPISDDTDDALSEDGLLVPLVGSYYSPADLTGDVRAETIAWLRSYRAHVRALGIRDADRRAAMNRVNPRYVLRNYLAQLAIDDAANGDFALIHELLDVLRDPYADQPGRERFAEKRPDWARTRVGCSQLSCSS